MIIHRANIRKLDITGDITIPVTRGWWFWKRDITYRGSGTVWYDVETGRRAGLFTETILADEYTLFMWNYRKRIGV